MMGWGISTESTDTAPTTPPATAANGATTTPAMQPNGPMYMQPAPSDMTAPIAAPPRPLPTRSPALWSRTRTFGAGNDASTLTASTRGCSCSQTATSSCGVGHSTLAHPAHSRPTPIAADSFPPSMAPPSSPDYSAGSGYAHSHDLVTL